MICFECPFFWRDAEEDVPKCHFIPTEDNILAPCDGDDDEEDYCETTETIKEF